MAYVICQIREITGTNPLNLQNQWGATNGTHVPMEPMEPTSRTVMGPINMGVGRCL